MRGDGRVTKRTLSMSATFVMVAAGALCAAWVIAARGHGWLANALGSRPAILAGSIMLGCLLVCYILIGALWRLGRRPRRSGQDGSAAVEFALVLPIAITVVLLMIQAMLMVTGVLVIHHAAYTAVRAATVWVPEKLYNEPRNVVEEAGASAKLARIKTAAVFKLLPISASEGVQSGYGGGDVAWLQEGLRGFYSYYGQKPPAWIQHKIPGKWDYAWRNTEVALYPPENGAVYGDHEELRLWLKHTQHLGVPYASRMMELVGAAERVGYGGLIGFDVEVVYTLTNEGAADEIDVEQFPRSVRPGGL